MAEGNNQALIQEIKEKNEIVSVISEYVSLHRAGRAYSGLCPFHSEKTPSFNVNPQKQFFYCFGCGVGGDVISFLMKIENLDFLDAAKKLSERAGISWPEQTSYEEPGQNRKELYALNKLAAAFYQQCLVKSSAGVDARDYLEKRSISYEIWSKFYLGYALSGWNNLTTLFRKKEVNLETAESLGLVSFGENGFYDRFRERLIFPICDPRGNICGFGGRVFDGSQPKYLNSPDTALFHKGHNLYGLNLAKNTIRQKKQAIFVEGYMDVIQAHQAGFTQTVATLGTALTIEQVKLIKRYTNQVILAYDADAAGQNATLKGLHLLADNGIEVKVLSLPQTHDPDSFIREYGAVEFENCLAKAENLVDFQIKLSLSRNDLANPQGKADVIQEMLPYLAKIGSNVAREVYVRRLARELGITENVILVELQNWRRSSKKQFMDNNIRNSYTNEINTYNNPYIGWIDLNQLSPVKKAIFEVEKELLQFALQEYEKFERIKERLQPNQLSFQLWRQMWIDLLEKNPSSDAYNHAIEGLQQSLREVAVTLMAETEVRETKQLDLEGMINRLQMLQLKERIQELTQQISSGKNEQGAILSEAELREKILEFTELKKNLQRNFPNFSAEI